MNYFGIKIIQAELPEGTVGVLTPIPPPIVKINNEYCLAKGAEGTFIVIRDYNPPPA